MRYQTDSLLKFIINTSTGLRLSETNILYYTKLRDGYLIIIMQHEYKKIKIQDLEQRKQTETKSYP